MKALVIKNLEKTYKSGTQALKKINLKIEKGDFFALLGANGAGKTTMIGIISGLVNKSAGMVKVFGHDIDLETDQAKRLIGIVPQEFNFSIFEKVIDIIVTQAGYFGIPKKEALARAEVILKKMDLWEKRNAKSMTLSGGMKRRLMIARALIHQPKFLLLDEPTAGVDVELRYGMWEYLKELNKAGTTILLTTHYLEEVEQLCKNVAIIKQGEIVKHDTVKNLLRSLDQQTFILTVETENKQLKRNQADLIVKKIDQFQMDLTEDGNLEVQLKKSENISDLIAILDQYGIKTVDIRPKNNRLEQLFLNILKN